MKIQVSQVRDSQVNVPWENLAKGVWYKTSAGHYFLITTMHPHPAILVQGNAGFFEIINFSQVKYLQGPFQIMDSGFSVEICNSPVVNLNETV